MNTLISAFCGMAGVELDSLNFRLLNSFEWKFPRSKQYINFLVGKSKWVLLAWMFIQMFVPYKHFDTSNWIFILYTLLSPVVYLMYFVKYYMNEKYDNDEENAELCKVVYVKLALDCFQLIWIVTSYNGLLIFVNDGYLLINIKVYSTLIARMYHCSHCNVGNNSTCPR